MVFNFYFNKDGEPNRNKDIEDIMKKMELHFADWNDFYQFYMKHANLKIIRMMILILI